MEVRVILDHEKDHSVIAIPLTKEKNDQKIVVGEICFETAASIG